MKRALLILLAAASVASAQTFITVTADTNRVIRTNFSLVRSQVSDLSGASFAISNITGLQTALDGKLATNGSAAGLTNFPASVLLTNSSESVFPAALLRTNSSLSAFPQGLLRTNGDGSGLTNLPNANLSNAIGVLPIANGGTGSTNASNARTALELGTAATNDATAFQPASTNLDTLANNNGGALTNVSVDLTAALPAYSNNAGKVLAVASGETNVEWTAISNTVTDASTLTNFPASILQTNSADTNFPAFLLRTNGSAAGLSGLSFALSNASDVSISNIASPIIRAWLNDTNSFDTLQIPGNTTTNQNNQQTTTIGIGAVSRSPLGTAVGFEADSGSGSYNVAIGADAVIGDAANAVQIGVGTNTNTATAQILSWGSVDSTEWGALANSTGIGREIMQAPTNGTNGQVLVWTNNDVAWATSSGGLPEVPLAISNGGTGSTNTDRNTMQVNLGLTTTNSGRVLIGYNSSADSNTVTVGVSAAASSTGAVAVGHTATALTTGSVALGYQSDVNTGSLHGIAIGYGANIENVATNSIAIGRSAFGRANSAVQIGTGSNSTASTIQFLTAGTVNSTEWGYLANASTQGGYAMTNTEGISGTKTFVAYDGTNYTTNTVTFSNGIITGWTP